ncbi:stage III sporulation protein AD [Anaerotignum sp.]|uniref:stage III sporulation protein AD n=1 Tax=Anaerotignum sp. TaxID=2039241 RepID=UPI0027BA34B1|nr:stage III sporulation protein AD [Anaerotignum sp.]
MAGLATFGLTGTFLALVLKKENPQFALLTALATGVLLFLQICSPLGELLDMLRQMAEQAGVAEGYFSIVLKVIGIAYLSQFASQLCADAGEGAVAAKIELAGKVLIMAISIPVLTEVLHVVLTLV